MLSLTRAGKLGASAHHSSVISSAPMSRRFARLISSVGVAVMALAVASCGGDGLAPVTGAVKVDGKPAARAIVMFHPENPSSINETAATATTAEDGTFVLSTGAKSGV